MSNDIAFDLADDFTPFYRKYYKEDILELANNYPEETTLHIEWSDLFQFHQDSAELYVEHHEAVEDYLIEDLQKYDLPIDIDFSKVNVAVRLPQEKHIPVEELSSDHVGSYVSVSGQINHVSDRKPRVKELGYVCGDCGRATKTEQPPTHIEELKYCPKCSSKTNPDPSVEHSETVDQQKLKLKQTPETAPRGGGKDVVVYATGELAHYGGPNGLQDYAGERAVIHGVLECDETNLTGRNAKPEVDYYLVAHDITFEDTTRDELDIEEYRDEFEPLAKSEKPYLAFAENIAPSIETTDAWETALLLGAAYLFSAPRIEPSGENGGETYRGDIHMLIPGDPGTAKSLFARNVSKISPQAEHRSATGLSSEVGLTAAATQDGFDGDEWVLQPGILVRNNGGHTIIEEIDKANVDLTKINDALEGEQMVTVDKAGISATLKSRTGLLCTANPIEGRFNDNDPLSHQFGIEPSLLSRFDAVVAIRDTQDEEQDEDIADHILESISESAEIAKAEEEQFSVDFEADTTSRDISLDSMRAWVLAGQDIFPTIGQDVLDMLKDFYVKTRSKNDNKIATTARKLESGVRYSMAFARLRLDDEVKEQDAELAIELSKAVIGQTFDPTSGEFDADMLNEAATIDKEEQDEWAQLEPKVIDELRESPMVADELARAVDKSEMRVRDCLDNLKSKGRVYSKNGKWYLA